MEPAEFVPGTRASQQNQHVQQLVNILTGDNDQNQPGQPSMGELYPVR
jgi:hypothetical protein